MHSGHQALRSPPHDSRAGMSETSPPGVPRPVGMDANQLKARLYATSEVHNNARPQLKVIMRRRSRSSEVGKLSVLILVVQFFLCRPLLYERSNPN